MMEDYKELIKELKSWLDDTRGHEIPMVFYVAVCKAVQAIEQLVKERDAAIADLFDEADYNGEKCFYCAKDGGKLCEKCKWEWRGVTDEIN